MVLFQHVKNNLSCLDETTTLLGNSQHFLLTSNSEANLQGAYLYYDSNNLVWIRSGKVTGRGFKVRDTEHLKKAKAKNITTKTSRFYVAYPSIHSARATSKAKKGVFEDLRQYIALGFDPSKDDIVQFLTNDMSSNGLLSFDKEDEKNISKVNFRNAHTMEQKKIEMVAYLIEIVYDISICPADNISVSPGYEPICGAVV